VTLSRLAQPDSSAATAIARTGTARPQIRERPKRIVVAMVLAFNAD
jgi:hypothetical protein